MTYSVSLTKRRTSKYARYIDNQRKNHHTSNIENLIFSFHAFVINIIKIRLVLN